jgi:hypothetical protein
VSTERMLSAYTRPFFLAIKEKNKNKIISRVEIRIFLQLPNFYQCLLKNLKTITSSAMSHFHGEKENAAYKVGPCI